MSSPPQTDRPFERPNNPLHSMIPLDSGSSSFKQPSKRLSKLGRRILETLAVDNATQHGYELTSMMNIQSGTLYPLLNQLQSQGFIHFEWEQVNPKEVGRPQRKLINVSTLGRQHLRDLVLFEQKS
jgi:DNA-binding PadR family transcriptional regulator